MVAVVVRGGAWWRWCAVVRGGVVRGGEGQGLLVALLVVLRLRHVPATNSGARVRSFVVWPPPATKPLPALCECVCAFFFSFLRREKTETEATSRTHHHRHHHHRRHHHHDHHHRRRRRHHHQHQHHHHHSRRRPLCRAWWSTRSFAFSSTARSGFETPPRSPSGSAIRVSAP